MMMGRFRSSATNLPTIVAGLVSLIEHFCISAVAIARFVMLFGALRLCKASVASPRLSLGLIAIVILSAACGIFWLQLHVDGRALSPSRDATIARETLLRSSFGLGDPIIIYFDTKRPDGIFNTDLLTAVSALSSALEEIPGLPKRAVFSLATEIGSRVFPGSLRFKRLLDPIPDTADAMQSLRDELRAMKILEGVLITTDRSGTCIVVRAPIIERFEDQEKYDERKRTIQFIRRAVTAVIDANLSTAASSKDGLRISIVGAPVAELDSV